MKAEKVHLVDNYIQEDILKKYRNSQSFAKIFDSINYMYKSMEFNAMCTKRQAEKMLEKYD